MGGFVCSAAVAADSNPTSQAPELAQTLPAVDGLNAKISGFGGAAKGRGFYGAAGSVLIPFGVRYGLQIDGLVESGDTSIQGDVVLAGTAAHLFWRDPSVGLLGLYGQIASLRTPTAQLAMTQRWQFSPTKQPVGRP